VQGQTAGPLEGQIEDRRARLRGVALPGDIGMEHITELACGVAGGAEEQHDVAHQSPTVDEFRSQRQALPFRGDFRAALIAGQPSGADLFIHRFEGQVPAHIGATAIGQQSLCICPRQRSQPQSRGVDRVGGAPQHSANYPRSSPEEEEASDDGGNELVQNARVARGAVGWGCMVWPVRSRQSGDLVTKLLGALLVALALAPSSALAAGQPPLTLGRTVAVQRVSGTVLVRRPRSSAAVMITGRSVIPVGSTIDTTGGKVLLTTATPHGGTQFGLFNGGSFVVAQKRSALTDLILTGGQRRTRCLAARAAKTLSPAVLRLLHGHAHGKFTTVGSYGSAAVRGTDWTTTDRCDGTLLTDDEGKIDTQTNNGAVSSPTLSSGESSDYRCATGGLPPVSSTYCIAVEGFVQHTILNGRSVTLYKYVAALATKSPADEPTELCITTPSGQTTCTQYPLAPPDPAGYMSSTVGCYTSEAGDYQFTYRLGGIALGAPLIYHSPGPSPVSQGCEAWLGKPDPGDTTAPLDANVKQVNRYSLPTAVIVGFEDVLLGATGKPGTALIRGVVYADAQGAPGAFVGATRVFRYTGSDGSGMATLTFSPNLSLPAGDYWIGLLTGGQSDVARLSYDPDPGALASDTNTFVSGPSDPFGPITSQNELMSLYLDYLVAT
jgi:hypothetical protein